MGGSSYSSEDHAARSAYRSVNSIPTFKYDADIKTGKVAKAVHASLSPKGVKIRESRDSDAHPLTMPIGVVLDVTGSMSHVPEIIQSKLSKLMGVLLDDKASGKKYIGDYYPAILIGAVDDYPAMKSYGASDGEGSLQVAQFESGIELDDALTNLWMTQNGGGTYEESYDLALYFFARHTATDHWEKRHKKGYIFIIGDEKPYPAVRAAQIKAVIGDSLESDISFAEMAKEVQQRYHVFFVTPNMTSHYNDPALQQAWLKFLPQQNVLKLEEPEKICELIASTIAICEDHINLDDLASDDLAAGGVSNALVALSRNGGVARVSAEGLPAIGKGSTVTRL